MGFTADITLGPVRLICGDMREVLPRLEDGADMVLSDPPYRITSGGNTTGEMAGCFDRAVYDNSGELFDMVEWADMARPIFHALKPDADAVIMSSDRELQPARAAFEAAGFGFHRLLVWDKGTATPNRWYMPNCEFALYLWKGKARRIEDCGSKALRRCPQKDASASFVSDAAPERYRKGHPTEKPVALMEYWMGNSTKPGQVVLDPFMGAGAVPLAALRSGRRAIGIEKDPWWFECAVNRVERAIELFEMVDPLFFAADGGSSEVPA